MWEAVRWLHLLAMAFFVGGQLLLATAVVPAFRAAPDREYLRAVARRFGWGTLAALAVLVATGIPLASNENRWDDSTLQAKLALVGLAALLVGLHVRFLARRALDAAVFVVSLAIVWLGASLAH
jgi:uncharacterized membrane protein